MDDTQEPGFSLDGAEPTNEALLPLRTHNDPEQYVSALGRAIAYWTNGSNIPLTVASELIEQGYDVGALERQYLK